MTGTTGGRLRPAFLAVALALVGVLSAVHLVCASTAATHSAAIAYSYDGDNNTASPVVGAVVEGARTPPELPRSSGDAEGTSLSSGLVVAAETGAVELPEALTVGRNAESGVDVYAGVREGKPVYSGITNDIERRAAEHDARLDLLD